MANSKRKKKNIQTSPESYRERTYRLQVSGRELVPSSVRVEETDLQILADGDVTDKAYDLVLEARMQLQAYIRKTPEFAASLVPLPIDSLATPLVREMLLAGQEAGVGPMAAVAGAVAGYVGRKLREQGVQEVIVENGGDIFVSRKSDSTVAIFAGQSPLSYNVGIHIGAAQMPCGVCTSSGTIGHSLSFGDADSVTVVADSVALADAAATRLGNEVGKGLGGKEGVNRALSQAKTISGLRGVVVICDEVMGAVGDVELVRLQ